LTVLSPDIAVFAKPDGPAPRPLEQLGEGQQPQVMVIACSDSRVDPSQIFDVDPGEIFVVRNVAALVPPFETTPGHHGVSAALELRCRF
jgi:carbonic anhydrase